MSVSVEKFKFSQILLDDKNATSLCSKNISTLCKIATQVNSNQGVFNPIGCREGGIQGINKDLKMNTALIGICYSSWLPICLAVVAWQSEITAMEERREEFLSQLSNNHANIVPIQEERSAPKSGWTIIMSFVSNCYIFHSFSYYNNKVLYCKSKLVK